MKNLVTGATGFIGSFIAENLVKRGEYVKAFTRKTSNTRFLESLGIEIFHGDLNNPDTIKKALRGMDRVFHSAAMVGDWIPRREARTVNVEGTKHLLDAAVNENIKRFIYVSSLGVLGMRDHHKTPSDAPRAMAKDAYIDTKVESEELVVGYGKKHKLPFTIIRPGFVFGPRDNKVIPRMVDFVRKGKFIFIGDGKNKVNMIYIENLIDIIMKATYSDKALGQIYNATNDSGMTMMDVVYTVSDLWGYKRPTKHISKGIAYTLCNILEFFAKIAKSKKAPFINKTRLKFLSLNLDFDITKTRKELGYTPLIDMKEGLRRTKKWIDETYGKR